MIYVKDGKFAPNYLVVGGRIVVNPTEEQYLSAGYSVYVPQSTSVQEDKEVKEEEVKIFSKLKIATLLAKSGKWTIFKNAMSEYVLFDGFTLLEAWETA